MKSLSIRPGCLAGRSAAGARGRRGKAPWALVVASILLTTPAHAQSFADSLRQLKESVRQLGGKRPTAGAQAPSAEEVMASQAQAVAPSDETDVVPAAALVDDTSDSGLERAALVRRRVETFDILGFKLGMSPREVGRVARRQGVRRQWNTTLVVTGSFELEATRLANAQLDERIIRRSRNYLSVSGGRTDEGTNLLFVFTLDPSGPKLSEIKYSAKRSGVSPEELVTSLERKYGPRDARTSNVTWTNGASTVAGRNAGASLLVMQGGPTVDMILKASNDYVTGARRRLEERAEQIARSKGGGVKF